MRIRSTTRSVCRVTVLLAAALLMQAVSLILLRCFLGPGWLCRPGALITAVSVIYQGVSPLLLSFPSIGRWNSYQQGISAQSAEDAVFILSAAMLAFTVGYLLARPRMAGISPGDYRTAFRALDWRLLAVASVPAAVLTYTGKGYNSEGVTLGQGASTSSGLAATFFVPLVCLTATALLLRHGTRYLIPVLAAQSLILAAAGERMPVITATVTVFVLLRFARAQLPKGHVTAVLALAAAAALAITGARVQEGRGLYRQDTGITARVSALGKGLIPGPGDGGPGLLAQAATRLDGTGFTAGVLQSVSVGQPRLSPAGVPESLLIAVPSAAWPSKVSHGLALNPAQEEMNDFGLQQVNFLPGLPGLYAGFMSPWILAALLAFLGLLAGWGERWLLREATPARLIILAGAVTAALSFETGLPGMLVQLRAALVLALAVKVLEAARNRRHASGQLPVTHEIYTG